MKPLLTLGNTTTQKNVRFSRSVSGTAALQQSLSFGYYIHQIFSFCANSSLWICQSCQWVVSLLCNHDSSFSLGQNENKTFAKKTIFLFFFFLSEKYSRICINFISMQCHFFHSRLSFIRNIWPLLEAPGTHTHPPSHHTQRL